MSPVVGNILLLALVVSTAAPVFYTVESLEAAHDAGEWATVEDRCHAIQDGPGCAQGQPVALSGGYCRNLLPDPAGPYVCDVKREAYQTPMPVWPVTGE